MDGHYANVMRILLLAALCALAIAGDPEANMKVPEIIAHWGYPAETIQIFTEDNYELTMHRIPFGKGQDPNKKDRPVVFLQHGLECSSSNWVTNLPSLAMGFMAADAGFDVWMGNIRGNLYSIGHKTLDTNSEAFWQFTWDEMVKYDLPAMIDHVLNTTGQPNLYYVGHSQGTLIMFSKLAADPSFAPKIKQFHALAPVGTVKHIQGLLEFLAKDFYFGIEILEKFLGSKQFLPESGFLHMISEIFCKAPVIDLVCGNVLFMIAGPESNQMNVTRIPVYLSDEPGGTSTMNILHWAQMVRSGKQEMYDYEDEKKNVQHYGHATPPVYDISKIDKTPIWLYWSTSDWLADGKDVQDHLLTFLNPKIIQSNNELKDFNHLDFIWGQRAAGEIYRPVIDAILKDINNN